MKSLQRDFGNIGICELYDSFQNKRVITINLLGWMTWNLESYIRNNQRITVDSVLGRLLKSLNE